MSHCIYYTDRAVQNEQILQLSITRRLLSLAYGKRYKQLTPEFGHFHLKMTIWTFKLSFLNLKGLFMTSEWSILTLKWPFLILNGHSYHPKLTSSALKWTENTLSYNFSPNRKHSEKYNIITLCGMFIRNRWDSKEPLPSPSGMIFYIETGNTAPIVLDAVLWVI